MAPITMRASHHKELQRKNLLLLKYPNQHHLQQKMTIPRNIRLLCLFALVASSASATSESSIDDAAGEANKNKVVQASSAAATTPTSSMLRGERFLKAATKSSKVTTTKEETVEEEAAEADRVLLPANINPTRYDIEITPDFTAFSFAGVTTVELTTGHDVSTSKITLHAKELSFDSASYTIKSQSPAEVHKAEEISTNVTSTTVSFGFASPIPPNSTLSLTIHYTGLLNNEMAGFSRSSYTDIHGTKKIMASTQFESVDARRCFPCIDEPARKAVFGVTLVVPKELDALSNMPESSHRTLEGGTKKELTFLDTPIMSTYLVAFAVGEFDFVQAQTSHGVLIRVHTPPGKSESGTFALDCATKSLDAFDEFFEIPYPLPKLDMVAIPEFAFGAMENWGLVTYREVDLLIDPTTASSKQKQRVCTVVAHELAHQWFGNLVTMEWWNDLWLNEGFASWAQNWATDRLYPQWSMWDQFTTGPFQSALSLDALKSSHPVQVPIYHAKEVDEVFDVISYYKGGTIVKMIRAVLGIEAFQKGLVSYMKTHAYGNTKTFDLWKAWEDSSGLPVQEFMSPWTEQMGYPLVSITEENWESDKVTLILAQEWFLSDGSPLTAVDMEKKWIIPIFTCTEEDTQQDMIFMRDKTATITVPLSKDDGWVKLNAGQNVPMRVKLTSTMIDRLSVGIESKTLQPADRAGILSDAFSLVRAGKMQPEGLIKLLSSYKNEDSYIVWELMTKVLRSLDVVMSDDPVMSKNFRALAKRIVLGLLGQVGWEAQSEDGHLDVLLRGNMIDLLSMFSYDDASVASEAMKRFHAFQVDHDDMKNLPSDMRSSVFKIVLENGGTNEYEDVKAYFDQASDDAEREHVLRSLGHTPDPKLKTATLEWAISGEIKVQNVPSAMRSVSSSSKEGRSIAWDFMRKNFNAIEALAGDKLMRSVIAACVDGFASDEKANEIEAFFKANPVPESSRLIQQTIESVRSYANFLAFLQNSDLKSDEFWSTV